MTKFDSDSSDPDDPMLAVGGFPSAVRHDPTGHEDCAMNWDACQCHGDRLCLLGKKMKWMRSAAEHAAWLRGEREDATGPQLRRLAGCEEQWELELKAKRDQELADEMAREMWPLMLANANQYRERLAARG